MKTTMGSEVKKGDVVFVGYKATPAKDLVIRLCLLTNDKGLYGVGQTGGHISSNHVYNWHECAYTPEEYKELLSKPERFDLCLVNQEWSEDYPKLRFYKEGDEFFYQKGEGVTEWGCVEKIPLEDWIDNPIFAWAKEVREKLIKQYGSE